MSGLVIEMWIDFIKQWTQSKSIHWFLANHDEEAENAVIGRKIFINHNYLVAKSQYGS
jgi:hypothetical protein